MRLHTGIIAFALTTALANCTGDDQPLGEGEVAPMEGEQAGAGSDALGGGSGGEQVSEGGSATATGGDATTAGAGGQGGAGGFGNGCPCEVTEGDPSAAVTTLECVCDAFGCPGFEAQISDPFCPDAGFPPAPTVMRGCGHTIYVAGDNYYVYDSESLELVAVQYVRDFEPGPPCGPPINQAPSADVIPECDEYVTCSLCDGGDEALCDL